MDNHVISIVLTLLFSSCIGQNKNKIYEFRGNGRTGTYLESNLLKAWPSEGPKEIMVVENIGNGYVSPVFTNDSFFITGEIDSMCILFCFSLNGEKQWQTTLGKEWMTG